MLLIKHLLITLIEPCQNISQSSKNVSCVSWAIRPEQLRWPEPYSLINILHVVALTWSTSSQEESQGKYSQLLKAAWSCTILQFADDIALEQLRISERI